MGSNKQPWASALGVGALFSLSFLAARIPYLFAQRTVTGGLEPLFYALRLSAWFYAPAAILITWVIYRLWRLGSGHPGSRWLAASFVFQLVGMLSVVVGAVIAAMLPESTSMPVRLAVLAFAVTALRVLPEISTFTLAIGLLLADGVPKFIPATALGAVVLGLAPLAYTLRSEWLMSTGIAPQLASQPGWAVLALGIASALLTIGFWFGLAIVLRSRSSVPAAPVGLESASL